MKKILTVALLMASACFTHAQVLNPADVLRDLDAPTQKVLKSLQPGAMAGDYQAMRNYAFTWSTDGARQDPRAAAIGCAWYALIMRRHPKVVHAGDASNKDLYCGRLSTEQARLAGSVLSRIEPELGGSKTSRAARG